MKRLSSWLLMTCLCGAGWAQSPAPGTSRPVPAAGLPAGMQPAVIIQLPPNSPNGGVRATPRPAEVAPVSPGQDTYSSTGAVPASQNATTYSSSGRVQNANDCVKGGVVRKCN